MSELAQSGKLDEVKCLLERGAKIGPRDAERVDRMLQDSYRTCESIALDVDGRDTLQSLLRSNLNLEMVGSKITDEQRMCMDFIKYTSQNQATRLKGDTSLPIGE